MIETTLARTGIATLARQRRRGDALILSYHNIVPTGAEAFGDPGLHLPQRQFAAQLDLALQVCDLVPLSAVLDPAATPHRRPWVAITFDDAYLGALTAGLDECAARGVPATLFVVPGRLDGQAFWWDALAAPTASDGWPAADRDLALRQCGGVDATVRDWALGRGYRSIEVPPHARAATETALQAAAARPGVTVAAHSWTHPNLAALDAADLALELERPRAWLGARFPNTLDVLAYPYGLASAAVRTATRAAGYAAGLLVTGGWWRERGDRFAIPRLNVPAGLSLDGFALRTADLFCA